MPIKILRTVVFLLVITSLVALLVSLFNIPSILYGILVMVITGRIAGTDLYLSFEAVLAGTIFATWLILTYRFSYRAFAMIGNNLKPDEIRSRRIEEIAL